MDVSELASRIENIWPSGRIIATTAELARAGLGPRVLTQAVQRHLVLRIRHGAYIRTGDWTSRVASEQHFVRLAAHYRATKGHDLYSHLSAARLLGLPVWKAGPAIHVTRVSSCSATSTVPGVNVHRRTLAPERCQYLEHPRLGLVRVTSLEQTIVDCAMSETFVAAVILGDAGLNRGASRAVMLQIVEGMAGRRGVCSARRVLAALNRASESAGETRLRLAVAGMDVPQPRYQLVVDAAGSRYRLDGAWDDCKLALEFDGKGKYFGQRNTAEAIYQERLRERRLMEMGWTFLRVVWRDLDDLAVLERRIKVSLAAAKGRTVPRHDFKAPNGAAGPHSR